MATDQRRIAFLKALIIAAWADGELSADEIRNLSYYLQRFQIDDLEYEALRPLLERPLTNERASELLEQQLDLLTSTEEQRTLVAAVEGLLVGDDRLDPRETRFLQKLRELTSNLSTAQVFIAQTKALWTQAAPTAARGRSRAAVGRFLQQRLLEHFRRRIAVARARAGLLLDDGIADADLYRAVIWAGLLARVAQVDQEFCPAEEEQLLQLLSVSGDLPLPDLQEILGATRDGSLEGIDLAVLVQEAAGVLKPDEAGRLLDGLFLVAAADGVLSEPEVTLIRQIAQGAGFTERAYHNALERCQRRLRTGWN